MALPTLPHGTPHRPLGSHDDLPPRSATTTAAALPGAARELVLTAPMLLFAHGILAWIDGLGHHGRSGPLWFLAQAALIGSVFAFVGLSAGVAQAVRANAAAPGTRLAAATGVGLAIVGTGLTTWVALVRGVGGDAATTGVPEWFLAGGPVLLSLSVLTLLVLARSVLALPGRTIGLALTAIVLLALPLELIPLAAIVMVLALEPLLGTDPALDL